MRQAFHILKKDVRYLWIEILVALTAAGLLAFTGVRQVFWLTHPHQGSGIGGMLLPYLLPLAWWTLIARAVHAETLVGDRQFWPTRPYAWQSLLAAKALLMLLFINLPLLVAQAAIVMANGFSLRSQLAGLLWTQLLVLVAFDLPVAAVAALTTGVVQYFVTLLIAFAGAVLLSTQLMGVAMAIGGGTWGPVEWTHTYYSLLVMSIAALAILAWQYRTRRTAPARVLAAAMVVILALGAPFSWTTAFAMQSRFSRRHIDESSLHAGLWANHQWAARALVNRDGSADLHIPLELTGAPGDMTPRFDGLDVTIEGAGGAVWNKNETPRSQLSVTGQLIALQTKVDGAFYQKVKDQPVRVRGYLYLTLFANERVSQLPFDRRWRTVPGMGMCLASGGHGAPYFLGYVSTFRPPSDLLTIMFDTGKDELWKWKANVPVVTPSYSPFPAELSLDPVTPHVAYSTSAKPLDAVTVVSLEPLAHVRAAVAIDGLRLADYEVRLK